MSSNIFLSSILLNIIIYISEKALAFVDLVINANFKAFLTDLHDANKWSIWLNIEMVYWVVIEYKVCYKSLFWSLITMKNHLSSYQINFDDTNVDKKQSHILRLTLHRLEIFLYTDLSWSEISTFWLLLLIVLLPNLISLLFMSFNYANNIWKTRYKVT